MKSVRAKNKNKQIICIIIVLMLCNFIMPNYTYAAEDEDSGTVFAPFCKFITFLCDNVMQFMQNTFTSTDKIEYEKEKWDFKYSPGVIFSGTVPAFDINFIKPNQGSMTSIEDYITKNEDIYRQTQSIDSDVYEQKLGEIKSKSYDAVIPGREYMFSNDYSSTIRYDLYYKVENNTLIVETIGEYGTKVGGNFVRRNYVYGRHETQIVDGTIDGTTVGYESIAAKLQGTVATWYKALRRISLVGLLSVLVYIGIRIVLSSASGKENSKYKKMLIDWLIAICLLFTLHYIMNATIVVTQKISSIFNTGETDTILNTLRNKIQEAKVWEEVVAEVIMYVIMTLYTVMFSFQYLKRVLYVGFFTMIAPLITLTYPLDKIKDSKAQAFTMWIREYIFNALIQVVHLIVYYVLVGSALSLVETYPLYGVIAIGLITQGEKIIRKMFGFDNATTIGTMGAAATGGLVAAALNKLQKVSGSSKNADNSSEGSKNNIRTVSNSASDTTKNPSLKGGVTALGGKYYKKVGGAVLGTGLGATGAMIGLAAGVAQGDVSAAFAGALAGGKAGKSLGQKAVNGVNLENIKNSINNVRDTWNEGAYGAEYVQNEKQIRAFKGSSAYEELKAKYKDNFTDDKLGQMLQAGVTEQKDMDKILGSNNIDNAIGYYTLAKKCPEDIYYDDKKLQMYLENLGISETNAAKMRKNMKAYR